MVAWELMIRVLAPGQAEHRLQLVTMPQAEVTAAKEETAIQRHTRQAALHMGPLRRLQRLEAEGHPTTLTAEVSEAAQ